MNEMRNTVSIDPRSDTRTDVCEDFRCSPPVGDFDAERLMPRGEADRIRGSRGYQPFGRTYESNGERRKLGE